MRIWPVLLSLACSGCWIPLYEEECLPLPPPPPPPSPRPVAVAVVESVTRADLEKLLSAGISDAVILEKARVSGVARLTADDIIALKRAGASDHLVKQLMAHERLTRSEGWIAPPSTNVSPDTSQAPRPYAARARTGWKPYSQRSW